MLSATKDKTITKAVRRNEVLLVCPHCGKEQTEPGLAISTFCRSCGEHYQIENGVALPPFRADDPGPRFRSTVTEGDAPSSTGFDDVDPRDSQTTPEPVAPSVKRSFFGFGWFLQNTDDESTSNEPEKKPIRCFECGHIHEVSIAASSTQCARCSLYISLSDQDIRSQYSRNVRTRGNVNIHRKGSVIGCEIACHDLTVLGKLSGSVDCSGNATFKNSGKVLGSMHCKHIVVDRKCELDFPQGIIAESADIYGVVRGDILCSGTIHIFKTGSVFGDATARAVVVKDGGVLTGQMRIQHDVDISLPKKGTVRPEQPEVMAKKTTASVTGKSDRESDKQAEKTGTKQDRSKEKSESTHRKKESPGNASKTENYKGEKKPDSSEENRSNEDNEDNEDGKSFKLLP